jgi:hypothetical protein
MRKPARNRLKKGVELKNPSLSFPVYFLILAS